MRLRIHLLAALVIAGCTSADAPDVGSPTSADLAAPAGTSGDAAASDAGARDLATTDLANADLATSMEAPDLATPDLATPDLAAPDLAARDLALSVDAAPDLAGGAMDAATADLAGADAAPSRLAFAAGVVYGVGAGPTGIAAGDLNGDGAPDLVVANVLDNTISVLLNQGRGTFAAQAAYTVGTGPTGVALADLDGDGKLDVATANGAGGNLFAGNTSVLLGKGDGTLKPPTSFVTGTGTHGVVAADLNGDALVDLAFVNTQGKDFSVLIALGNATYTQPATHYGATLLAQAIALADVDHNGFPDLVDANGGGTCIVRYNKGDGTFATGASFAAGSDPWSIAAVDLDGDKNVDLVFGSGNTATLSVLAGNANGAFAAPATIMGTKGYASGLAAADFDRDGLVDIAAADTQNLMDVFRGDGKLGLALAGSWAAGANPRGIVAADLDGDGRIDVAVTNNGASSVSVFLNASR